MPAAVSQSKHTAPRATKPRPRVRALPGGVFEGVLMSRNSIIWRSPITSTRARARQMAESFALDLVGA